MNMILLAKNHAIICQIINISGMLSPKTFGMSGLCCGILHSLNVGFISGLESINVPLMVSNMSQWMIKEMLSDDEVCKKLY